ncbi:hypothetical protein [Nonomuraea recticatena]|uniref:Uncharacterized protein n=1 Tax=Nonomuraea recticatena TaxID=46178 RepID=A0ABN3TFH1_9ACTN
MIGQLGMCPLLVAGVQDKLVTTTIVDDVVARRLDWAHRTFPSVGHLLPYRRRATMSRRSLTGWIDVAKRR